MHDAPITNTSSKMLCRTPRAKTKYVRAVEPPVVLTPWMSTLTTTAPLAAVGCISESTDASGPSSLSVRPQLFYIASNAIAKLIS